MQLSRMLDWICNPKKAYYEHMRKERNIVRENGKNPENTYFVIRLNEPADGLFALFMFVLDFVAYAVDHDYIPVLDSEGYSCLYKEKVPINGTKDPWLYYFLPLSDITVKDCKKFAHVIYPKVRAPRYKALYYYADKEKNVVPAPERIEELNNLVKKYMQFRPELQEKLDEQSKILQKYNRVLGVHVRGTDMFTAGRQHPAPSGKTKDFSVIDEIMEKHDLDGIFLCTDTESTVNLFSEYYGEKVITTRVVRQKDDTGTGIHKDVSLGNGRKNHKYLLGLEVITDMYLLSKCNVLVCGPSNVAFAAMIYNNNQYDKIYYFV